MSVRPAAEQLVEDERAPQVAVQRVLGGVTHAAEHLLRLLANDGCARARDGLRDGGGHGRRVIPGGGHAGLRSLDRHVRVGEPMADGLETGDGTAELLALERMGAGQLEHLLAGADEFVGERDLPGGEGGVPAVRRG